MVTAPTGTNWTVSSEDAWIQIISPASGSGSGNGTVVYQVLPDTAASTNLNHYIRVGTITISGNVHTVAQHAPGQVSYATWAAALPTTANGPGQDAVGNGVPNIVRYAFGLDPLKPSNGGLPVLGVKNGQAIYSLTKPKSTIGLRYVVQAMPQLGASTNTTLALAKVSETPAAESWQADLAEISPEQILDTTLVPVGVTAREVQKLLQGHFNNGDLSLALWNIQPGLGTVMLEYGRRMATMKLAADAGDWGMAQYQLDEALEIQETGETTRPANAPLLKDFEHTYLDPLAQDILAKNAANFAADYSNALDGCNACHAITKHPYVHVQLPTNGPEPFLQLSASSPTPPATNAPPAAISPASDTALTWAEVQQMANEAFNNVDTRLALWNIQPGLGTVMMEYGRRMAMLKLAADAGDWGMAQYQLTEATEIQETGETTRPGKAPLLKDFEHTYLDPLAQDILAKNATDFAAHFSDALDGCNACHKITGHPYVNVQPPSVSPQPFLLLAASDPAPPTTNAPVVPQVPVYPDTPPTAADAANLITNLFNTADTSLALWNIQPGLGTVMQEYGYRFAVTWFAAEAGNWGLAQYELNEALEIQETGETTRPAKAPLLKDFEQNYLVPLATAVTNKNKVAFESAYSDAIDGCNACHKGTGHSYVRIQRSPVAPVQVLNPAGGP